MESFFLFLFLLYASVGTDFAFIPDLCAFFAVFVTMVSESDNDDDAARLFAGDSARILGPAPTEMEGGAEFDGDFRGVAIVLKFN